MILTIVMRRRGGEGGELMAFKSNQIKSNQVKSRCAAAVAGKVECRL